MPNDRKEVDRSKRNKYDQYKKLMDDLISLNLFYEIVSQYDNNKIDLFKIKYKINAENEYYIDQPGSLVPNYGDIINQINEKLKAYNSTITTTYYNK